MEEMIKIIEWYNKEKEILIEKICSESERFQYYSRKQHIKIMNDRVIEIDKKLKEFISNLISKSLQWNTA
jgi:hypothetical protein